MSETMIERVARAIEALGPREAVASIEPSWLAFVPQARAAIAAVAETLDMMGTDSDEDMRAVEWISELLRSAALKEESNAKPD